MTKDQAAKITPGTVIVEQTYGLRGWFVALGASGREIEVDHRADDGTAGYDFWPVASCVVATDWQPVDDRRPNPIIKTTALRQFPGWTVREYRDGLFDAAGSRGLTRGVDTFHAAVDEVRAMETGAPARS